MIQILPQTSNIMASFDLSLRNVPVTPMCRKLADFFKDLSTVEEADPSNQTPEGQEVPASVHRSPGGYSNMSQATTAISSLSAAEVEDLDQDVISLELKPLYDASTEVVKSMAPMAFNMTALRDIPTFVRQPGSKFGKLYALREEAFAVHRKYFGNNEYIRPDIVEKALYLPKSPSTSPSRPRVDDMIQNADLAILLMLLVSSDRENTTSWNVLGRLDKSFPFPFISSFIDPDLDTHGPLAVGQSKLLDKTIELGIAIRTQLTIMQIWKAAERGRFDPDEELFSIWFEPPDDNDPDNRSIRGWETTSLGAQRFALSQTHEEMVTDRVDEIRQFFTEDTQAVELEDIVEIERLSSRFSWEDFVVLAMDWIRWRNHEITRAIQSRGGVDSILRALEKQIGPYDPESQTPQPTPSKLTGTPIKSAMKGSAKKNPAQQEYVSKPKYNLATTNVPNREWNAVKATWPLISDMNKRMSGGRASIISGSRQPVATAPEPNIDFGREGDWRPANADEEMEDFEAGPSTAPEKIDRAAQVAMRDRLNKENRRQSQVAGTAKLRFIDAQPDAQRVEWSQATVPTASARTKPSQVSRGKRPAQAIEEEEEGNVTEDEGFQEDRRIIDDTRRRHAPPAPRRAPVGPPAKKVRVENQEYNPSPQLDSEEEGLVAHVANAVSSIPSTDYRVVNAIAKDNTRLIPPKIQTRTRWTPTEEDALVDYIRRLGCSWSRIKKEDSDDTDDKVPPRWLDGRDQVALKDKARNMKFDFIKAGVQLPPNFEHVPLNARQKERLREIGIDDV